MKALVIFVAVLVGLFRPVLLFQEFNHHIELSYQALAHLLVGGLIGYYLAERHFWGLWPRTRPSRWHLYTAIALSAIEIVCATITVMR